MPKRPTLQIYCAMNRVQVSSSEVDGDGYCLGNLFLSHKPLPLLFPFVCACACDAGMLKQALFGLMRLDNNAFMFTFPNHFKDGLCFTTGAVTDSVALPSVWAQASETLITNRCCSELRIPLSGFTA